MRCRRRSGVGRRFGWGSTSCCGATRRRRDRHWRLHMSPVDNQCDSWAAAREREIADIQEAFVVAFWLPGRRCRLLCSASVPCVSTATASGRARHTAAAARRSTRGAASREGPGVTNINAKKKCRGIVSGRGLLFYLVSSHHQSDDDEQKRAPAAGGRRRSIVGTVVVVLLLFSIIGAECCTRWLCPL